MKYAVLAGLLLLVSLMGSAEATTIYVNETGWWPDDGAFTQSTTPI